MKNSDITNGIVVPYEKEILFGALTGFCHLSQYCTLMPIDDDRYANLLEILRQKKPKLVFVDLSYFYQIQEFSTWKQIQQFIQDNKIILCGIGNLPPQRRDSKQKLVFKMIFEEPLKIDEIIEFVKNSLRDGHDNCNGDRRNGRDRRKLNDRRRKSRLIHFPTNNADNRFISATAPNAINTAKKQKSMRSIYIDYKNKKVIVNGKNCEMSPREFDLINCLLKNKDKIISADEILKTVWVENHKATRADVHQYIYMLRNKLEKNPQKPKLLLTVKGFGYKLDA